MNGQGRLSANAPVRRILSASMLGALVILGGCGTPEHEVLYKAYADCLDEKKAIEPCQLERAKYEAAASRAQIEATRGAGSVYIAPSTYTPPPPVIIPPPAVSRPPMVQVPPPAYVPPARFGRTW